MLFLLYVPLLSNFIHKALLTATATEIHLHLGHLADAFIQGDLQLVHLSEEKRYIAVGTVRMLIEPRAYH